MHAQWAYFVVVLPTGYIRTIYHGRKNALSGEAAVIPSGYARKEKPMATPAHDSGTGNQFVSGYNRLTSKRCTCTHYVTFPD